MPTVKIPLGTKTYRNVHGEELADLGYDLIDGYIDELGYCRRRPGLQQLVDINSAVGSTDKPINGFFWWPQGDAAIAYANGNLIKLEYDTGSGVVTTTDLTSDALNTNATVISCTDGTYVYAANGGKIVYTDGTATSSTYIADVDCPTAVSHVAYLDSYILCNSVGTNKFYFSDVGNGLSWTATSFFSAASNPDYITALHVLNREIFLFGKQTVEIWENDGESPFSRIPGGTINSGLIAPYSVIQTEDSLFWLDHNRHFVRFQNGRLSRISTPYDKELKSFTTVTDARGYLVEIDGRPLLVWTFTGEKETLVYDFQLDSWSRWYYWNIATGEYERFLGNAHLWVPDWGIHLVGDRRAATIFEMDSDLNSDYGAPIRMKKLTGHIDYGTTRMKRSEEMRIRAKRGAVATSSEPMMMIRWRNDNSSWSNERWLSLGSEGDREIVMQEFRTGAFRTRQYEFVVSDAVPVAFGEAEEDITLLR